MSELITDEYREQNIALHEAPAYGTSGSGYRELVRPLCEWGRKPLLDYGCGKGTLKTALGPAYTVHEYDPAVPGKDTLPEPCEVVVSTDVLEHIEPDLMDNVLSHLRELTTGKLFLAIALTESSRTLPDGRNAHLSLHTPEEWRNMFDKHGFKIVEEKPAYRTKNLYWVVLE